MLLESKEYDGDSADEIDVRWYSLIVIICMNNSSFLILEWSDAERAKTIKRLDDCIRIRAMMCL